jgi:hypothetical protein
MSNDNYRNAKRQHTFVLHTAGAVGGTITAEFLTVNCLVEQAGMAKLSPEL